MSFNDLMLGKFSINSCSGKEALINLDVFTFDINIAIDGQNVKTIKRNLKGLEFVTKDDGSWYINKDFGNYRLEVTVKQS